jgi:8-oxo-dGTP pyrophosphatase MutT (NUDIX family)
LIPGGGIDAGESPRDAAARELLEETGLSVDPSDLGQLVYSELGEWLWGDGINSHTYEDQVFELDIESLDLKPESLKLDNSQWTQDEHRDVLEIRWWKLVDLIDTNEPVSPKGLTNWLRAWR